MAYTDDTVYNLRECTGEYSSVAILLRNEKEYGKVLDKILKENAIALPNTEIATDSDYADHVTEKLNECIEDYIRVRNELEKQKHTNQIKQQMLEQNGIKIGDYETLW